jgi:hypothetical protein
LKTILSGPTKQIVISLDNPELVFAGYGVVAPAITGMIMRDWM